MSIFDQENSKSYTHEYFEEKLDNLGLSVEAIKRQDNQGLQNLLQVANHAIQNHQSFGELKIRVPSENGEFLYPTHSETEIKVGILPILLERYRLILDQQQQYGYGDTRVRNVENDIVNKENRRNELTKIAHRDVNWLLWILILILIALSVAMFLIIRRVGWNTVEPWTYLLGFAPTIISYIYFAVKQRELSLRAIYQNAFEARKKELFKTFGVEEE